MSTALAAARAKTKGKRMLRDALNAYGDEDTSLSKWNARKKQAVEEGKWQWKESVVSANAAIKARFDKEDIQSALKQRFVDVQAAMEAEMSSAIHQDQHGGQLLAPSDGREDQCCWRERIGGKMHHCTNLLPLRKKKNDASPSSNAPTKRLCLWHAAECSYGEHPMERSRVIEIPNEFGMCLHCYEETAGTLRATLQKVPPRIGAKQIPGVCLTDVRKEVKREAILKHPGAGLSSGAAGGRTLGPNSLCAWQKEHSEVAYVWRCTNRVLMHPMLRGSYLPFCGFHTPRCIQDFGKKGKKEQACPLPDRRNQFGLCRNHLEAHLSSLSFEERGRVLLVNSDFDAPGIKECRKEEVIAPVVRHPLAPKYPPPLLESGPGSTLSMDLTTAVAVLPSRLPPSRLQKFLKKARAVAQDVLHQLLDHPNPVSLLMKEAVWRLQFMRRAELVAIRIQRVFRGNRARRRVRLLLYEQAALDRMQACRVLQRFARGFLGRRRFEHEHDNVHQAVPHIQRLLRGALARKHFRELCAAIRIQRNFRLYRQRLLARAFREEIAYMHALQRQADVNYIEMEKQLATFRRLRARRVLRAHIMRWKRRQEIREQEVAERLRSLLNTVKIQRQWRRYRRYMQMKKRYGSAQAIQKRVRGWLTRHMWLGDPGVEITTSYVSARSGFRYDRVIVQYQPSRSYSYPSRKIRMRFGALAIQRVFRGHLGRLKANSRWVSMLKRWEWLGISASDSSGQLSDSMTVGRHKYGFVLPSFAYHRDTRHHMRPVANDPVPNRGHAYKYQYILDLIKDRDGRRGWSLAKEEMHARQLKEEQAWLEAEDARRRQKEAELAAKELRKHVFVKSDPLARSIPISMAVFPVGSLVNVAPKLLGRGVRRRAKVLSIHQETGPNGELSASFDVAFVKPLRNSYGRMEDSGELRVPVARLCPVPLVAGNVKAKKHVGTLIEKAIDSLCYEINSKRPPTDLGDAQYEAAEALPTVDAIATRLRDCREGRDLLYDHRQFVDFVFRNSTLLRQDWLQVVSCIRYGSYSKDKRATPAKKATAASNSMMEMFYREFNPTNADIAEEPAIIPMPERARVIEQRMTQLGFKHDSAQASPGKEQTADTVESGGESRRPETTPVVNEANRIGSPGVLDDMMLFRGEQPPQTSQDLHRLIYELKTLPREARRDQIIHISSRRTHAYVCSHPACGRCFSSRKVARLHQTTSHEGRERLATATPLVDQYLHSFWPPGTPWDEQKPQRMVGYFGCSRAGCEPLQFRTRRELNRHRLYEHGLGEDAESSSGSRSPPSRMEQDDVGRKRSIAPVQRALWLGPYVVCHSLETKLGIPATTLTSPRTCLAHDKPDQLCTTCFLQQQRPVAPFRLYSAVALRKASRGNSIRMEASDQEEEDEYLIFRDDDDEFCPAANLWGVHSVGSDALASPKRKARGDQPMLPDPLSTVLYMRVTTICRDAAGEAWLFGRVLAHRKRPGLKSRAETAEDCEVVWDTKRGLSFVLLSQVVGAASIYHCSKSLLERKYCPTTEEAPGLPSQGRRGQGDTKILFCRPTNASSLA